MDGISAGRQMEEMAARQFSAGSCWQVFLSSFTPTLNVQEEVKGGLAELILRKENTAFLNYMVLWKASQIQQQHEGGSEMFMLIHSGRNGCRDVEMQGCLKYGKL